MRLIDADAFLERTRKDPLFPLVERYGLSGVIENEPTVEAIPVEFIEKYAQLSDDAVALFGVPVGVLKNVYRSLIDEWRKENESKK